MTERTHDDSAKSADINPGYAAFQIAKALTTIEQHEDPAIRERAKEKIAKWEGVLRNILSGDIEYGTRTPVEGIPGWATLEVITGGFATGELLAGGQLQAHETELLEEIPVANAGDERLALNAHYLSEKGLSELQDWLQTGCYDINVPEEGALLVVAWLVHHGYVEDAHQLLNTITPYFSKLRFFPIPQEHPRRFSSRVHLQDVGKTIEDIRRIKPNKRILAQKEAVELWAPLHDSIVAMFLETVKDDWPCRYYPEDWSERAQVLLDEYKALRKVHTLGGKYHKANGHAAQLREFFRKCATSPGELTGREVGRIRLILNRYISKRGTPNSPGCLEVRRRQAADVGAPMFHAISGVIVSRLERYSRNDGLDDLRDLHGSVTEEEAVRTGVPQDIAIPASIQRKVERCLNETVDALVERGLITSGETLATVLPQMTSGIRAMGITDPTLRQLYSAIYRAFRRRRSLLLLNLEKQIQIEELPWIKSIERFRSDNLTSQDLARQTLEEITILTLTSFPHATLPNKLLQELRALITSANLDIPLVDELAVDIFMGEFSGKFVESARRAAGLLNGSLYATYYGIDYDAVRHIPKAKRKKTHSWFLDKNRNVQDNFAQLCAKRAGVSLGTWDTTINGMIIEQQQILTTQNLAALFSGLDLAGELSSHLAKMAKQTFQWICRRQQMKIDLWHARLIMLKNTAYAWRQMVFFLALLTESEVSEFLQWASAHLNDQSDEFRKRFHPILYGLILAADGVSLESDKARNSGAIRFLGWSNTSHSLINHKE